MAQPTFGNVQQIDPVLTNLLIGYEQQETRFVAPQVFPYVPIEYARGTYYIFSKKYFFTDEMKERAPGAPYARSGFGLSTGTVATLGYGLAFPLADEIRQNNQAPMDLEDAGVRWLAQKLLLRKEIDFQATAMALSVWGTDDNGSTAKWNNYTTSDPVKDVLVARRTISNNTGLDGNTMVLGYFVHQSLINHPDFIDRVKYTQMATAQNMEQAVGSLLGLEKYIVGKASYTNTNEAATFSGAGIIGSDALVLYTTGGPGLFIASAGYTFVWDGGGGQGKILRARDEINEVDLMKVKAQWQMKAVATDLGYFYHNVVS